jgi:hypothetical protein
MRPLKESPLNVRLLASALFLGASAAPAFATSYYLGSTAAAQPGVAVASVAALNALQLRPGDHVYFQGGETFSGTIALGAEDAGTPASPVELTSYGTGRAIIAAGSASAVKIYNAAGFTIHDLDLRGADAATSTGSGIDAGVYLPDSSKLPYLRFDRMRISGFKKGVEIWGWYSGSTRTYPGFTDVRLTAVEAIGNLSTGIETWGTTCTNGTGKSFSHSNLSVAHCTAANTPGDPASKQHTGSGILIGGVDGAVVEYCSSHDNGGAGPTTGGGPFGIWAWESRGVKLQYNLVYNQRSSSGLDGGAFDLDGGCSNSVVQYNYSYNNEGPGLAIIQFSGASPLMNSVIRYNISENDGRKNSGQGIIYVGQFSTVYGIDGAEIHGNTVFTSANARGGRPAAAAVQNQALIANVHLRNNIFIATHTGSLIGGVTNNTAKALYQGNDYWGGTFDLTTFRNNGQEKIGTAPVGARVDPQLSDPGRGGNVTDPALLPTIAAYTLKTTSPLIGEGLDLAAWFGVNPGPTDFYGVPIISSDLDVGAAAARVAVAPPPPPTSSTTSSGTADATAALIDDQFSGSTSLGGRTPDTTANGAKWVIETGTGVVSSGVASANISLRSVIDAGAADATIDSAINLSTTETGLILRSRDSANYLRLVLTSTGVRLQKTEAGVTATIASVSRSQPLGQSYTLHVVLGGPAISVTINGVAAAAFSTSFNQTMTRHGLLASGSGVRSWDYFKVSR